MQTFKQKFGLKLKEQRKKIGISQEEFAEWIEISPRNLSRIETGQTFPSVNTLEKIIEHLNCDTSTLFEFENYSAETNIRAKILKKLKAISKEKLVLIYKFIKVIE